MINKNSTIFFRTLSILVLATICWQCEARPADYKQRVAMLEQATSFTGADERLLYLMDLIWDWQMTEFPTAATWNGYPGQDDRWEDMSADAIARRKIDTRKMLALVKAVDQNQLSAPRSLDYALVRRQLELDVQGFRFPGELLLINQMGGVQQDIAITVNSMPAAGVGDYNNILARLRAAPALIRQHLALLDEGRIRGITPPRITLREVPAQILNMLTNDPLESPLLRPFKTMPETVPEEERKRLVAAAKQLYISELIPVFRHLHDYIKDTYIPSAREQVAFSRLENGNDWYRFKVARSTTTDLTPEAIHQLGLKEVARIRAEMEAIIEETKFDGGFEEFNRFLREDDRFFHKTKRDLLVGYRDIAKRADPELIRLFGKLPRTPYGVIPIPAYAEKSQTTAYYYQGSASSGRPGYFYANTYDLKSRPIWEMEALTLHEAVPGHHLQISLAQEQEGLHPLRRNSWAGTRGFTAFVEGWGLYAESLGEQMGFYRDPYSRFGQLSYEMWRAVRLVVDTGMHAMGWNRQQAIDYFAANSPKPLHDIEVEIDRYLVWPGQALAYKIGELKFKELKTYARERLGDKFDIREFHDRLLEAGELPMDLLESRIKKWVRSKQK